MRSILKMSLRTVKTFFGRYMAIFLIVALSAGFFAGLKITKATMVDTALKFFDDVSFYDYRVISTLGFTEDDVKSFETLDFIKDAEGSSSFDALISYDTTETVCRLMSVTERVDTPSVVSGRLPKNATECIVDDERFDKDDIGKRIKLSKSNSESTLSMLGERTFEIVGIADSPLFIGIERGTSGIGNGSVNAFVYLHPDAFSGGVYTEIAMTLTQKEDAYTDGYAELIDLHKKEITQKVKHLAQSRYQTLLSGMTPEMGLQLGIAEPETYLLTRNENAGYINFDSDSSIVSGVADIFPVFFILIAMLVCMTTMSRMVDEERTQIGVLKALGFGYGAVTAKYMIYAGSATILGWAAGYFVCTWGLPEVFWFAYNAIYDFAPLEHTFSPMLAGLSLAVSLICILGSTFLSCRKELASVPAALIRPRAVKNGKRILLERITPLWKRLKFLHKITLRNMFRYKQRLFMMIAGIGCCCGLVVTAFGIRESMVGLGSLQYDSIQTYDIEASFSGSADVSDVKGVDSFITAAVLRTDAKGKEPMTSLGVIATSDTDSLKDFWHVENDGESIAYPKKGECVLSRKAAELMEVSEGDSFVITDADRNTLKVKISRIFDNYLQHFAFIDKATYESAFGEYVDSTAFIKTSGDPEAVAKSLTELDGIKTVSQTSVMRESIDDALDVLNYIIWIVILFSGALAFVVTFNLTNINLAERAREIATVQVLGFYKQETESYVLRENIILSVIAGIVGLPLGLFFHTVVMSRVKIDLLFFNTHVSWLSYLLAFICTVAFAFVVDLFMRRRITKIKMAESLKAVE